MKNTHPTRIDDAIGASLPQPIDLLRRLADTPLPARVVDQAEIEALCILELSGSVKAAIPAATGVPGGLGQARRAPARVDEVTRLGLRMLRYFVPREARLNEPFCGIVQPVGGETVFFGDLRRDCLYRLLRLEDRIHVACGVARIENDTHDGAADDAYFTDLAPFRERVVQFLEKRKYLFSGKHLCPRDKIIMNKDVVVAKFNR